MGVGLPNQGFFWWPGIDTFLHGTFSFTHGISPSLATLFIAPQLTWPDMTGDLSVNYLPGAGSYNFTDCLLDFISIEREPDGRQVWGLHILDRRWKWKDCGRISGNYNVRRANGDGDEDVWTPTLKVLKDLMQLCLEAMGEDVYGFDLSQVIEEAYPEVEWDYENPAQALLQLCDKFGYRVVLTLENQVLIAKANQGEFLPADRYLSGATTINPPNTPSSIVVAAGRTVAQYDFELEAVALETDGTIVPLDEVSYAPQTDNGWGDIDLPPMNKILDDAQRSYALKSVFKYYRIKPPFEMDGVDELNPQNDSIDDIIYVLPLLDVQITKAPETPDAPSRPLPAWIYGKWATLEAVTSNASNTIDSTIDTPDAKKGFYTHSFTIDADRGLVIFSDYTFAYSVDENGQASTDSIRLPAELFLRTSCNVRDQETFGWLRAENKQDLEDAGVSTKPMYVKSDDVALKITYQFEGEGEVAGSSDNSEEVDAQAAYLLAATVSKMQIEDPQSFEYPGFRFLDLDGAIQQITWTVAADGKATTQANRCKEDLVNTPSYEEAKQAALLQAALAITDKTDRVKKQSTAASMTVSGLGPNVSK